MSTPDLAAIEAPAPVAFHRLSRPQLLTLAIALQDQRDRALAAVREQAAKLESLAAELDTEAAASDNVAAEIMKAPRTNAVRQELRDHEQHATIATNHATRIRAALEPAP